MDSEGVSGGLRENPGGRGVFWGVSQDSGDSGTLQWDLERL